MNFSGMWFRISGFWIVCFRCRPWLRYQGYTKPEFVDGGGIAVVGARHPMVEQILVDSFVPNDIQLKV